MQIKDFGKQTIEEKVSSTNLKRRVNKKSISSSPTTIEEDFPPIYGISEQQLSTLNRIRRTNPAAYNRMRNWD